MKKTAITFIIAIVFLVGTVHSAAPNRATLPKDFVYLDEAIPGIVVEMSYITSDNFVGQPVDGYTQPHAILSQSAASALAKVQEGLRPFGLGLKIFDAYRPQRAVDHFVRWGKDLNDQKTKSNYYPDVSKENLFRDGYIAARSSHSRGSTVDLTLVYQDRSEQFQELDMGSRFDFFGPISWPKSTWVSAQQRANRLLLRRFMVAQGFSPYAQEWWHFTLRNEPHPNTYFDFPN